MCPGVRVAATDLGSPACPKLKRRAALSPRAGPYVIRLSVRTICTAAQNQWNRTALIRALCSRLAGRHDRMPRRHRRRQGERQDDLEAERQRGAGQPLQGLALGLTPHLTGSRDHRTPDSAPVGRSVGEPGSSTPGTRSRVQTRCSCGKTPQACRALHQARNTFNTSWLQRSPGWQLPRLSSPSRALRLVRAS